MAGKTARLRGRIGAHPLHAKYDSREITAPARAAFMTRFEKEVHTMAFWRSRSGQGV